MDEKKDGIELLREYADGKKEKRFCPILHGHYGDVDGDCMRGTCAECEGGYLAALADRIGRERDELDKRLMPLGMEWPPKDCEGEGLHIGEKAHFLRTGYDGDHEWDDVIVAFRHQGVEGEGDAWIVVGEDGEAFACDCAVERPAVLAADGLPIEAGQTVYAEFSGSPLVVERIEGAYLLDAGGTMLRADCATHTPPDTQERIDDDACLSSYDYLTEREMWDERIRLSYDTKKEWRDRMRRAKWADLKERQRELDAHKAGGAK